ncbi:hypothetical protein E4J66_13535 [Actinomyces viscosus]|nr:hypothetical protein E4J66_13535 [Actinomyces viscosus]
MVGWDRGLGRHGCSWSKRECGRAKPTRAPRRPTSAAHRAPPRPRRRHRAPPGSHPRPDRATPGRPGIRPRNMEKRQRDATPTLKVLRLTRFRGKIMA